MFSWWHTQQFFLYTVGVEVERGDIYDQQRTLTQLYYPVIRNISTFSSN